MSFLTSLIQPNTTLLNGLPTSSPDAILDQLSIAMGYMKNAANVLSSSTPTEVLERAISICIAVYIIKILLNSPDKIATHFLKNKELELKSEELELKKTEQTAIKTAIATLTTEPQTIKNSVATLTTELQTFKTQADADKATVASLQGRVGDSDRVAAKLRADIEAATSQYQQAELATEDAMRKQTAEQSRITELLGKVQAAQSESKSADAIKRLADAQEKLFELVKSSKDKTALVGLSPPV